MHFAQFFRKAFWQRITQDDFFCLSKAVAQKCFVKKLLLKLSQNSQKNASVRDSFLIKLQAEPCSFIKKETLTFFKNTFSYRTSSVAAPAPSPSPLLSLDLSVFVTELYQKKRQETKKVLNCIWRFRYCRKLV